VRQSQNQLFGLPRADLDHILRHAAADLHALRGAEIFLTGGTGFFGKWLLAALARADSDLDLALSVYVLSRDPTAFLELHPEVDENDMIWLVDGDVAGFTPEPFHVDYVIHAATDTTSFTTEAEENTRAQTIIEGTRRMLELAQDNGARRMLNISSGAVYGASSSQPTGAKESDDLAAVTAYGKAKREAEQLCAESSVDFVTARAFAFLGPYLPLDAHFAAGNFLRDARKGGPILVRGDGTALRSYLHPADLVIWLLRMLVRGKRGRAYNVGSDEVVTIAQLAQTVARASSPTPEVVIQSAQPQGPQNIYLPDVTLARTELDLKVRIPLAFAIPRTLDFLARA
jgi:dTDP-glucose 4,6-dehydratase